MGERFQKKPLEVPKLQPEQGRVPPCDLDAEAAVLSACLLHGEALDVVRDILVPDDLYADANTRILEAIYAQHSKGQPADIVQVAGALRDTGRLDQVGGTPYLAQLADATPSVANVADHARRVLEKCRLRRMIAACQTLAAEGYGEIPDAAEWLSRAEGLVFQAAAEGVPNDADESARDVTLRVVARLSEQSRTGARYSGITAGSPRLTAFLNGYQKGYLHVVAARPAMGKSAKVLGDCIDVARTGEHAIFISLEMDKEQIALRAIAQMAKIELSRLRAGTLNRDEWQRMTVAANELGSLPLTLSYRPGATLAQVRSSIRRSHSDMQRRFAAHPDPEQRAKGQTLGLVAVDYLQLMNGDERAGENREAVVARLSRGLVLLAAEIKAVLIAVCQLNRAVESRADKRPLMSDLRESGAIEQDAYVILFIYRDDYYNKNSPDRGLAEMIFAKVRDGETGTVKQKFTGAYTRFDDLAAEEYNFDNMNDDYNFDAQHP